MSESPTLRHWMIDLETLSTKPDAAIISIGLCNFDPITPEHQWKTVGWAIDINDAVVNGRVDGSTIKWWMSQSDEARQAATSGTMTLESTLFSLRRNIGSEDRVWGNGPTFDISILESAFARFKLDPPWHYASIRDVRTIRELSVIHPDEVPPVGIAHKAQDDALWQAQYVSRAINRINGTLFT